MRSTLGQCALCNAQFATCVTQTIHPVVFGLYNCGWWNRGAAVTENPPALVAWVAHVSYIWSPVKEKGTCFMDQDVVQERLTDRPSNGTSFGQLI
eukprot:935079-Amphidinium_carterae.1